MGFVPNKCQIRVDGATTPKKRKAKGVEAAAGVSAGVGLDPRGEAWVISSMTRGESGGVGKAKEGVALAPKKKHIDQTRIILFDAPPRPPLHTPLLPFTGTV